MEESGLGKTYHKGEVIIRQGDKGENMYVLQSGQVEVIRENPDKNGEKLSTKVLGEGNFFGMVPLFERTKSKGIVRSTVRALSDVQVITVDRKTLFRKINEDPSIAYQILETMSRRIMELEEMVSKQKED
jgi:CRP-like cAMP-binding protein